MVLLGMSKKKNVLSECNNLPLEQTYFAADIMTFIMPPLNNLTHLFYCPISSCPFFLIFHLEITQVKWMRMS